MRTGVHPMSPSGYHLLCNQTDAGGMHMRAPLAAAAAVTSSSDLEESTNCGLRASRAGRLPLRTSTWETKEFDENMTEAQDRPDLGGKGDRPVTDLGCLDGGLMD